MRVNPRFSIYYLNLLLPISSSDAEALGLFSWGLFTLFIGEEKEMSDVGGKG